MLRKAHFTTAIILISSLTAFNSFAKKPAKLNFNKHEILATQGIDGKLLYLNEKSTDTDLIIQNENTFSYYPSIAKKGLTGEPEIIEIADNVQFFNKGKLANQEEEVLLYIIEDKVIAYDIEKKSSKIIVQVDTLYTYEKTYKPSFDEFANDLNQDGLTDILTYSLTKTHIYMQQKDGSFHQQTLDISPIATKRGKGILFTPQQFFHIDANNDEKKDLNFQIEDQLISFMQNDEGTFSSQPVKTSLNANLENKDQEWNEDDEPSVAINAIEDINGDGVIDVITKESVRDGMMSRKNQLFVRYGQLTDQVLSFNKEPDSKANFEGEGMITFKDINGDGLKDYYTLSVEMGLGTMMSVMSGSIDMDLRFYKLNESGKYDDEPAYENEIEMAISSNDGGKGLSEIEDFDGDGLNDLIIKTDDDEFKIYHGDEKRLFARRGAGYEIDLPKNVKTHVKDYNGDGKADILFLYGKYYDEDEEKEVGEDRLVLWLSAS